MQGGEWILQDSNTTNPCESTVVTYAPVDGAARRPVIDGQDSSGVALLPCGFAVVPDGLDPMPAVITSRKEEEGKAARRRQQQRRGGLLLFFFIEKIYSGRDTSFNMSFTKYPLCSRKNVRSTPYDSNS
jgi:homeobox-leucine zipper protein